MSEQSDLMNKGEAIQIDPAMTPEMIGEALVAGVIAGDRLERVTTKAPRWWWKRREWYRARECAALERVAVVLEQYAGRRQ